MPLFQRSRVPNLWNPQRKPRPPVATEGVDGGLWLFNDPNSADATGRNRSAVPVDLTPAIGPFGSPAWTFNGTSSHFNLRTGPGIDNMSAFTAWCWYRQTANEGTLFYKSDNNSSTGWWLHFSGAQPQARICFTSANVYHGGTSMPLNTWQHIAMAWNGSAADGSLLVYQNGVPASGTSGAGSGTRPTDVTVPLWVGRGGGGAAGYFTGDIDHFGCVRRVLGSTEIARLYREPFSFLVPGT